jgi:hypothetical protein
LTQVVPDTSPVPLPQPSAQQTPQPQPSQSQSQSQSPVVEAEAEAGAAMQIFDGFDELLVRRLMQRVDVGLEQHLHAAIAKVVQEQTRSVLPRLREKLELVVRQVVYEAVADEMDSQHHAPLIKK